MLFLSFHKTVLDILENDEFQTVFLTSTDPTLKVSCNNKQVLASSLER